MGNGESKSEEFAESALQKNITETVLSSPISTSKADCLDPRSPSNDISRTPLELTLNGNNEQFFNNDNTPVHHKILDSDPRSPTTEYDRTPIIICMTKKPGYIHNKNLDNVFKLQNHLTTPVKKLNTIIPPKLLESSPANISQINKVKRQSFVGLLETNIDYTETDLDDVINSSNSISKCSSSDIVADNMNETNNQAIENETNSKERESSCTPKVNIENIKEISIIDNEFCDKSRSVPLRKVIDITANVNDLDKKLSNLIYEDNNTNSNINKIIVSDKVKENNRNPLTVRNINEKIKLKVSDKPRKCDYTISKIPIYKKKLNIQCENTPPKDMKIYGIKTKKSHWDGDVTLVI